MSDARISTPSPPHEAPARNPHLPVPWAEWVRTGTSTFSGYALDADDPARRLVIELLVDGVPAAVTRADLHHPHLAALGIADGCFGFRFALAPETLAGAACICVRVANTDLILPGPGVAGPVTHQTPGVPGTVEWLGGLRFRGWIQAMAGTPRLGVSVDGEDLGDIAADLWTVAHADGALAPARGFQVTLPDRFADGSAHRASFTPRAPGLPAFTMTFLAFADGLRAALEERPAPGADDPRAELFDRLFPRTLPFERYAAWRAALPPPPPRAAAHAPIAVVLLGETGLDHSLESLAQESEGWMVGVFPTDPAQAEFDPETLLHFMRAQAAACPLFLFLPSGATLYPGTLERLAQAFETHGDATLAHLDFDLRADDGALWPMALPAADYERTLEQGFAARALVLRRPLLETALQGGARTVFRLATALYDPQPEATVATPLRPHAGKNEPARASPLHLPGACVTLPAALVREGTHHLKQATLDHLHRLGTPAACRVAAGAAFPAVRVVREARPDRLSVVVNAMEQPERVLAGLHSLLPAIGPWDPDLILLVDPATPPPSLPVPARHMPAAHLSRATALNAALRRARGDVVVHVDAGILFPDTAWLEELMGRVSAPRVGAAACLLRAPGDGVGDAGYVLGPRFDALPALQDRVGPDPGPGDLLRVAHEAGALSWRCIAIHARAFAAVGGLDDLNFPSALFDVDFSLRLRERGARLILTPHARALLTAPARPDGRLAQARRARELARLRARWGEDLACDPYYNPILTHDGLPFSALSWPAQRPPARRQIPPRARAFPPGL